MSLGNARSKTPNQPHAPPCRVGNVSLSVFRWVAPRIEFWTALQGNPEVGRPSRLQTFKAFCRCPDDGEADAVDIQRCPQYIRVTTKAPGPVVVTDHSNRRMIGFVLFR